MIAWTLLIIAVLTAVGFIVGRARAQVLRNAGTASLHSLPTYHGLLMASMGLVAASIAMLAVTLAAGPGSIVMPAAAAASRHGCHCRQPSVHHPGIPRPQPV